ncbi:SEC-C metal-binding domain-containing protein [Paraburkholderia strydomiana]
MCALCQSHNANAVQTFWQKSPGVNEPCPCRSGRTYKRCCRP